MNRVCNHNIISPPPLPLFLLLFVVTGLSLSSCQVQATEISLSQQPTFPTTTAAQESGQVQRAVVDGNHQTPPPSNVTPNVTVTNRTKDFCDTFFCSGPGVVDGDGATNGGAGYLPSSKNTAWCEKWTLVRRLTGETRHGEAFLHCVCKAKFTDTNCTQCASGYARYPRCIPPSDAANLYATAVAIRNDTVDTPEENKTNRNLFLNMKPDEQDASLTKEYIAASLYLEYGENLTGTNIDTRTTISDNSSTRHNDVLVTNNLELKDRHETVATARYQQTIRLRLLCVLCGAFGLLVTTGSCIFLAHWEAQQRRRMKRSE